MLTHETFNSSQFVRREPEGVHLPDRRQPELSCLGFPGDVNVRGGSLRSLAKKKNRYGPFRRTVGLTRLIVAASPIGDYRVPESPEIRRAAAT